jgi:hypothetical protein
MQWKPITAIVVLMLVNLLIAGCTSSTSTPTSTPSETPSAHTVLETLVNGVIEAQNSSEASFEKFPTFNVTWHNESSVTLDISFPNPDFHITHTWIAFPTTEGATIYLNGVDKSHYTLSNITDSKYGLFGGLYWKAMGYYAQTFRQWEYSGPVQVPSTEIRWIIQRDNILQFTTQLLPTSTA